MADKIKESVANPNFVESEWEEEKGIQWWMPETEGEMLVGRIVKTRQDDFGGLQYYIKTENGDVLSTPSHKWLQNRLAEKKVGDVVAIRYEGEEAPKVKGHDPTKVYRVFKRKD